MNSSNRQSRNTNPVHPDVVDMGVIIVEVIVVYAPGFAFHGEAISVLVEYCHVVTDSCSLFVIERVHAKVDGWGGCVRSGKLVVDCCVFAVVLITLPIT